MSNSSPLVSRDLGIRHYQEVWQEMRDFTEKRGATTSNEVWLLEHPHVFTQGKAGKTEHLLHAGNVPVVQTDRGGQITYHGPGQLIIYPLFDLRRAKVGVKKFVYLLEKSVIDTLADYGIATQCREDAPGIYLIDSGAKICSLGLRIYRGCSYHGLALNVTTDLKYFKRINPCGFKNLAMANVGDFVKNIELPEEREKLKQKILFYLARNLGSTLHNPQNSYSPQAPTTAAASNIPNIPSMPTTAATGSTPPPTCQPRKPSWIRNKLLSPDEIAKVKQRIAVGRLNTVCDEAACPNRSECFGRGTATFIVMGNICTRNCQFCNVTCGKPQPLDITEPTRLADTIHAMQLKYSVITSVCRDDLPDDGAAHLLACMQAIRQKNPEIKVEILAPDFKKGIEAALEQFSTTQNPNTDKYVDVFGHNIETVPRLYSTITPARNYQHSLQLLLKHKQRFPNIPTKSGIMVGLGETIDEIKQVLQDLRANQVDMLTIGQYLQPQRSNAAVVRYVTPEEFVELGKYAKAIGFTNVASGPLVRSSYYADRTEI
jgi:lipoyl synthase